MPIPDFRIYAAPASGEPTPAELWDAPFWVCRDNWRAVHARRKQSRYDLVQLIVPARGRMVIKIDDGRYEAADFAYETVRQRVEVPGFMTFQPGRTETVRAVASHLPAELRLEVAFPSVTLALKLQRGDALDVAVARDDETGDVYAYVLADVVVVR